MKHRRLLAGLLAAYSVVVASGAPLPLAMVATWVMPAVEESAERFPCEACPCGCSTAARCWGSCCCHTLAERLAWAKREGVRPPESALDEAQRAGLDIRLWRPEARYVVKLAVTVIEETQATDDTALPPCCRKQATCCEKPTPAGKHAERKKAKPGVALLQAMACHGIAEAWLALGQAPIAAGPELITAEQSRFAGESPAPLWCSRDEAPQPPPPDRMV